MQVSLVKNNVLLYPVSFTIALRKIASCLWRPSSCIINYPDIFVIALIFLTLFQLCSHNFRPALQPSNLLFIMSWDFLSILKRISILHKLHRSSTFLTLFFFNRGFNMNKSNSHHPTITIFWIYEFVVLNLDILVTAI